MGEPLTKFYFIEEGEVSLSQRSVSSSFKLTKSRVRVYAGDFFGESIFFESQPTAAQVVAVSEDVFVITISKEMWVFCSHQNLGGARLKHGEFVLTELPSIAKYLGDVRSCMDSDFKFRALRTVPILKSFTDKDLLALTPYFEEELFEDKQYIITEGEEGNTFYIIKSGVVIVNSSVIDMRTPSSTFTSKSTHIKSNGLLCKYTCPV